MKNNEIEQDQQCQAFCFNKDNSILIFALDIHIKVYEFKFGQLKQIQLLSGHYRGVQTLDFMNNCNQFISGGWDKQILIWSQNQNRSSKHLYKFVGHISGLYCLVVGQDENLIISGDGYGKLHFWVKKNGWKCSQIINDHKSTVYGLSLNNSQDQLISCGLDYQILVISKSGQNSQWILIQQIKVYNYGIRLCFINDNKFIIQSSCDKYLHIYEKDDKKKYQKTKEIAVKGSSVCEASFPQLYIESKSLILNKNGPFINIIQKNKNNEFKTVQSIKFRTHKLYGSMSKDGEYLITWDTMSAKIQIMKCHKI